MLYVAYCVKMCAVFLLDVVVWFVVCCVMLCDLLFGVLCVMCVGGRVMCVVWSILCVVY